MSFGGLVDAARRGTLDRRSFLRAALALGVGAPEAAREVSVVRVAVHPKVVLSCDTLASAMKQVWNEALLESWYPQNSLMSWLPKSNLFADPGSRVVASSR